MSVENVSAATDYNGATATVPLACDFLADDASEIFMSVLLVGGTEFIAVDPADYAVTPLGGGAFTVTPALTYASGITVRVFRWLDYTQPVDFEENGPLPAQRVTAAVDRLCWLIQQVRLELGLEVAAVTLPPGAALVLPTTTFADNTARGNATPAFLGQLGVQLNTGALYRGTTIAGGGWTVIPTGAGTTYTAGDGLDLTVNDFSVDSTVVRLTGVQVLADKELDSACLLNQSTTRNCPETEQTLADGASIVWNASAGGHASVTLGGNRAMANPTQVLDGATYILTVIQDGTGSRTLSWGADFKWPGGSAPTLTATAGRKDVFEFVARAGKLWGRTYGLNYN